MASSYYDESFRPSATPGNDTPHIASADARSCDRPGCARSAGRRTRPASDMPPSNPDRLLRFQTDAGNRAYPSETAAAARRYTTDGGVLKQPDKHKDD